MKYVRAGVAAATAALILGSAGVASASVKLGSEGGFSYVKQGGSIPESLMDTSEGDADARCAKGSVRTGGGATLDGPASASYLSTLSSAQNNQWFAGAWQSSGQPSASLTSWAVCTKKKGKVSQATDSSSVGAGPITGMVATECEVGHVSGGGVRPIGAADEWFLNSSAPFDSPSDADQDPDDGWRVFAFHQAGAAANTLLGDAICMKGKAPTIVQKLKTTSALTAKLSAKCPAGASVTGGGAFASGPSDEAHIVDTRPFDAKGEKGSVPDDGWKAKIYNDGAVEQTFRVYAICR